MNCSPVLAAGCHVPNYLTQTSAARGQSSLFSPTQTRKKCSTDPDAEPSYDSFWTSPFDFWRAAIVCPLLRPAAAPAFRRTTCRLVPRYRRLGAGAGPFDRSAKTTQRWTSAWTDVRPNVCHRFGAVAHRDGPY